MKGLGVELERYYEEACGLDTKKEKKKAPALKKEAVPLKYRLFGDFLNPPKAKSKSTSSKKKLGNGAFLAHGNAWGAYHFFKKAHRMITW